MGVPLCTLQDLMKLKDALKKYKKCRLTDYLISLNKNWDYVITCLDIDIEGNLIL